MPPQSTFDPSSEGWISPPDNGFTATIGPLWTSGDDARRMYAILTDERHRNHNGGVHGGLIAALADHAMGNVARHAIGGQALATIQMDVQYLAAGRLGDFLVARSNVVRKTRSIVFARCTITSGDRDVAAATGVWKILGA